MHEDDWRHDEHYAVLALRDRLGVTSAAARAMLADGHRRGQDVSLTVAELLDRAYERSAPSSTVAGRGTQYGAAHP